MEWIAARSCLYGKGRDLVISAHILPASLGIVRGPIASPHPGSLRVGNPGIGAGPLIGEPAHLAVAIVQQGVRDIEQYRQESVGHDHLTLRKHRQTACEPPFRQLLLPREPHRLGIAGKDAPLT